MSSYGSVLSKCEQTILFVGLSFWCQMSSLFLVHFGGMDHLCHAVSSMPFSHSMEWRDIHMAICVCMSVHSILCVHIYNALPEIHDVRLAGVSMSSMNGFQGNHNTILSFSRPSMWIQGGWHPCMEFSQFIYTLYFCYKFAYSQKFFSSSAFS